MYHIVITTLPSLSSTSALLSPSNPRYDKEVRDTLRDTLHLGDRFAVHLILVVVIDTFNFHHIDGFLNVNMTPLWQWWHCWLTPSTCCWSGSAPLPSATQLGFSMSTQSASSSQRSVVPPAQRQVNLYLCVFFWNFTQNHIQRAFHTWERTHALV